MNKSGQPIGGMLAMSGKEFKCKIGDSMESIKEQNPTLTDSDIQQVFNITREEKEPESDPNRPPFNPQEN